MQMTFLLALALVVRTLQPADGVVDVTAGPGQRVVAAYTADFEPVWNHADPKTVVDRLEAARSGRVTDVGPSARLVVALADENARFESSRRLSGEPDCFPYSPELVGAYEKASGRSYLRDMMAVAAPFLGSQAGRAAAVAEVYETLFDLERKPAEALRSFGSGASGSVLVVTGRARTWSWLERCQGDDGSDYARRLAEKGCRADLADRTVFPQLAVDADGFVRRGDCRYGALVVRHFSRCDAEAFRRAFGNRALKTKVYATDSPVLYGAELTLSDPDLPADASVSAVRRQMPR